MRARTTTLLLMGLLSAGHAHADWAGFYAPAARAVPDPLPPVKRGCDAGVPSLSAVPALGDSPGAAGCGVAVATAPLDPASGPTPPVSDLGGLKGPDSACVAAIRGAEARYGIPDNLLLGIGLQEAGIERGGRVTVWPWSVNAEGEGRFFREAGEALAWVREQQGAGSELIDVGCMQVNLRWHPDAFATLEEAFDPVRNVDYAARYLSELTGRLGDWRAAVGRYHSADPDRASRYLAGVETNLQAIRTGIDAGPERATGAVPFNGDVGAYLDALVSDEGGEGGAHRPLWSAGLGAGPEGAAVYGLYGEAGLRPVLPAFQRNF